MANVSTGLPNGGKTGFFQVTYDDTLSTSRGRDLAASLMRFCDEDMTWLNGFFPGGRLPYNIFVNLSANSSGGASWLGWDLVPMQVEIQLGEASVVGGDPLTYVRLLLVTEVSEMFMRGRQLLLFNAWFGYKNEGNKGEALSLFLAVLFLREKIPTITMVPRVAGTSGTVSNLWLNSARANWIDRSSDNISPDDEIGALTLFLFYLHDQLGYSALQIIDAGAKTLADVYNHLTGDSSENANKVFTDLVNLHYPSKDGSFFPPMETVFPVLHLRALFGPPKMSWDSNGFQPELHVVLDRDAAVRSIVKLTSEDSSVIKVPPTVAVTPRNAVATVPLSAEPQNAAFVSKTVKITAEYAGVTQDFLIRVVKPDDMLLKLIIDVKETDDPCRNPLAEGESLTLQIKNLSVMGTRTGLTFSWSASGATFSGLNDEEIVTTSLPAAGTQVTIDVKVTRPPKVASGSGHFQFVTTNRLIEVEELERQIKCRVAHFQQMNVFIPPWIPVLTRSLTPDDMTTIERQSKRLAGLTKQIVSSVQELKRIQAKRTRG